MREDESIDAFKNRRCDVFCVLSMCLRLLGHRFEDLALNEARLSLLATSISDPFLRQDELFRVHLQAQLNSIDDDSVS